MDSNKKKVIIKSVLMATGLLIILTASYAFIKLDKNDIENREIELNFNSAKDIVLTYKDCVDSDNNTCSIINGSVSPGTSIEKTFRVENNGESKIRYSVYFEEVVNSFKNDDLVYSLVNLDTDEVLVENTPLPVMAMNHNIISGLTVDPSEANNYKVILTFLNRDYDQNYNMRSNFYVRVGLLEIEEPKTYQLKTHLSSNSSIPTYTTASSSTSDIYRLNDNYGTSYYYRGSAENNYLLYDGLYYRIVRVNGDGTVRIVYDGTSAHDNGEASDDRLISLNTEWNNLANDNKFVGYMYGVSGNTKDEANMNSVSSNVKAKLDEWYKTNIYDKGLDDDIADSLFCNDRSTSDSGYGKNETNYNSKDITTPSFTCSNANDAFTMQDTMNGNGSLTYPVGLLTVSEVIAAGSGTTLAGTNTDYYLNKGNNYWTMTPYDYSSTANNYIVNSNGGIDKLDLYNKIGVAPVINLRSDVAIDMSGSGTKTDPYTIAPKVLVTFDYNGLMGSYNKSVRIGSSYGDLPELVRSGFEFGGWYTDRTGGEKVESGTILTSTEPITLYAHWLQVQDITFTSANLPDIGYSATSTDIVIPERYTVNGVAYNVVAIGERAFYDNKNIVSVSIPDSVTSIGEGAFQYCSKLTNVRLSKNITSIEDNTFWNSGLTSIDIPSGVVSIGSAAFLGCFFTTVTLPSTIRTIGDSAFYSCQSLTSINIPYGVTIINDSTFYQCSALSNISLASSITTIDTMAFYNCTNLRSISLPSNLTTIGKCAFQLTGLTSLSIPSKVTLINDGAFGMCYNLTSLTIPGTVKTIGEYAFSEDTALQTVTLSSGVTTIGEIAFSGCTALRSVSIPASVIVIGDYAFMDCPALPSVKYRGTTYTSISSFTNAFNTYNSSNSNSSLGYQVFFGTAMKS